MGNNKAQRIEFECDMCGIKSTDKQSSYNRKVRHFCSMSCYSEFRKTRLPKEEQHRYGTGFSKNEQAKRAKCRSITNKAIRSKKLIRKPCEVCGSLNSEAHHANYDEPLNVKWLCFEHHREWHKIYENPELLKGE